MKMNEGMIENLKKTHTELELSLQKAREERNDLETDYIKLNDKIILNQNVPLSYVEVNKFYHNLLQELKGNIRVFCRVRPPLHHETKEIENYENDYILYPNDNTIVLNQLNLRGQVFKNGNVFYPQEEYTFDKIFKPQDSQEKVFEEISQLVQSALDGYKVCIFAYGQTGSGKTYTMQGELNEKRGIIPRSLEKIFSAKESYLAFDWHFTIETSCVEIYCDQVRDLLLSPPNNIIQQVKPEKFKSIEVHNVNDFYEIINIAAERRAVAETQCNEKSSRSHCIFQIKIIGKNTNNKLERYGALNLIDLAGSERISHSKVEGQQ